MIAVVTTSTIDPQNPQRFDFRFSESFTTSKETQDSRNFVKNQSVGPDDVDKEDDDNCKNISNKNH